MEKRTVYMDDKTGEVVSDRRKFVSAAFDDERGYLFWARKSFAKSFAEVDFPEQMTSLEIGQMTRMAKKIWSNTNMLGYRGNGGVKPYDTDMIAEVLQISPRQAYRFVAKMQRLGVLARVTVDTEGRRETQYYVNPMYFFSSNRIPLNLYLLFRKQLDAVLPGWVIRRFSEQKVVDLRR